MAKKFHDIFDLEGSGRVLLYSVVVGVIAGLGAAGFFTILEGIQKYALGDLMGYHPPASESHGGVDLVDNNGSPENLDEDRYEDPVQLPTKWWLCLLIPSTGGLVVGWLVYRFCPEAEGHGTDGVIKAFHSDQGRIRARVPIIKAIASAITIGTGGSAGREGPIAQIGAGFGSFLATKLKLSDHERRMLLMAGAAGGISAMFHAPVGGSLFAIEVLYATTAVEFAAFVPCVCASVVAFSVYNGIFGLEAAFRAPANLAFGGLIDLPFYLVFAVLCALLGFLYVTVFYGIRDHFFKKLPIPKMFIPAIGGLMLGVIIIFRPEVMAGGYGWIQKALDGQLTLGLMASLALMKIVATSCTISSGGSGGVFAPSLFIGAMLGGAFGIACNNLFPGIVPSPEAFVLIGMGGFFAGVAKVPLTALIMVSEMSSSYSLLVPLMVVSVIHMAIISRRWTLYEQQVPAPIDSPAHLGDFVVDVLAGIRVREIYQPKRQPLLISEATPLPEVLNKVAHSNESYFPVINDEGLLTGIFSLHDIRATLTGDSAGALILASDLARSPVSTVTPEDNLHDVLRLFARKKILEIPVVAEDNPNKVSCMLSRSEVLAAYDSEITKHRKPETE
jgi:chloride channel protein, CIC family